MPFNVYYDLPLNVQKEVYETQKGIKASKKEDESKINYKNPTKEEALFGIEVHKTLRCLNMSISGSLLRKWYDHVKTNLECSKRERLEFEYTHREAPIFIPFILPHEFLFLLCNSLSRIETVRREHKLKFESDRGDIYQWEIADGKPIRDM
jgi:hypothetical protein